MAGKRLLFFLILFYSSILFQALNFSVQANDSTVTTDILNVRSGPGLSYDVIDQLQKNESFQVLSKSNDWLEIQYDQKIGWVASWLTSYGAEQAATYKEIISQTNGLNIRSEPSLNAPIISRLNAGDRATYLQKQNDWIQIQWNERIGWVYHAYVTEVDEKAEEPNEENKQTLHSNEQSFKVAVGALNVRADANLTAKKVALIYKNEQFQVMNTVGNWVQITLKNGKKGWVYSFHGQLSNAQHTYSPSNSKPKNEDKKVTILTNGTNIRSGPSTSSSVVLRAKAGEQFTILNLQDDWYEIEIQEEKTAYVANWVVSVNEMNTKQKKTRIPGTLQGITIVLDPGHGGNDKGTTSVRGTFEKTITLKTAELLAAKLKSAGAEVYMTRETDQYLSLKDRVWTNFQYDGDAFISIHYDANLDPSIHGFTTYYQYPHQRALAESINDGLQSTISLRNRGTQASDYYVLRNNKENAVLVELGFLTNAQEELMITSEQFREQVTYGMYKAIVKYFNE